MHKNTSSIAEAVATASLSAFACLPKTGKPQVHEHTALAAICLTLPPHASECLGTSGPLVVSLATGTKCLPGSKRAPDGSALNDCHAEVLARRAFLRWMYDEIHSIAGIARGSSEKVNEAEKDSSFIRSMVLKVKKNEGEGKELSSCKQIEFIPGVGVHLFISHPPCGDAAIETTHPRSCIVEDAAALGAQGRGGVGLGLGGRTGAKPIIKRQKIGERIIVASETPDQGKVNEEKRPYISGDRSMHDTTEEEDWVLPHACDVESYSVVQATGIVRRKPGRGDPTLSVSCSDKVARWTLLGIQGALLASFLSRPVYLDTLTVAVPMPPGSTPPSMKGSSGSPAYEKQKNNVGDTGGDNIEEGEKSTADALKRAFVTRTASLLPRLASCPFFNSPSELSTSTASFAASDLDALGLLQGDIRKVAAGTSISWRAPPSARWKVKEAKRPVFCSTSREPSKNAAINASGGESKGAVIENKNTITKSFSAPLLLLPGDGFSEALIGTLGTKAGVGRKGAAPVAPPQQSTTCRAALFRRFIEVQSALGVGNVDSSGAAVSEWRSVLYNEVKDKVGKGYTFAWKALLETPSPFEGWIKKPDHDKSFVVAPR